LRFFLIFFHSFTAALCACRSRYQGADKSLAISLYCRGVLVGRTNFWMFFEWLAKVRATG